MGEAPRAVVAEFERLQDQRGWRPLKPSPVNSRTRGAPRLTFYPLDMPPATPRGTPPPVAAQL